MKLVLVWTAVSLDKDGRPTREPSCITYCGATESAASPNLHPRLSAPSRRVRRKADRRSFSSPCQVVLKDGVT